MDPKRRAEIAAKGGRSAHAQGLAHKFTSEEGAAAGRKGGASVAKDRAHMAAIGRKGGLSLMSQPGRAQELCRLAREARTTPEEKNREELLQKLEGGKR